MPTKKENKSVLNVLVRNGSLKKEDLEGIEKEAERKNGDLFAVLKGKGVAENELLYAFSRTFRLPKVDLAKTAVVPEALSYLPERLARKELALPFDLTEKELSIAIATPETLKDRDKFVPIANKNGLIIRFFLASENQIKEKLSLYHKNKDKKADKKIEVQQEKEISQAYPLGRSGRKGKDVLDVLVNQDYLKADKALNIREEAKKENINLFSLLKVQNIVPEEVLYKAYASSLGLPYVSLGKRQIEAKVLTHFPKNICERYQMVVFDVVGERVVKVATSRPEDSSISDILDFVANKNMIEIDLYVASEEAIENILGGFDQAVKEKTRLEEEAIEKAKEEKEALEKAQEKEAQKAIEQKQKLPQENEEAKEEASLFEKEAPEKKETVGNLVIDEPDNSSAASPTAVKTKTLRPSHLLPKSEVGNVHQLEEIIKTASVPQIVSAILAFALLRKASDIHFQPGKKELRVRFRIDGVLYQIAGIAKSMQAAAIARIKIMAKLRIDEQRIPQDGRFDFNQGGRDVDIRVSTFPTVNGEKAVLRLLDKKQGLYSLEELGLEGRAYKIFKEDIKKPYGIIIATGPTGSGKSTTLYSALSYINKPEVNIVTLEDPVEYEIDNVAQAQARPDIGFSFAEGLRSIVRQDPDIIMVGEIRDTETAALAIHAALTGHLVFSSLHTNDAAGAIPRIIDMGIEPFLIISAVNLFLAQRLVRKICKHCKEEDKTIPPDLRLKLEKIIDGVDIEVRKGINKPYRFYRGKGCRHCTGGYSGRIGIFEVLPMSPEIERMTVKHSSADLLKKEAKKEGMLTIKEDGLLKALRGITTVEEVLRVTVS